MFVFSRELASTFSRLTQRVDLSEAELEGNIRQLSFRIQRLENIQRRSKAFRSEVMMSLRGWGQAVRMMSLRGAGSGCPEHHLGIQGQSCWLTGSPACTVYSIYRHVRCHQMKTAS